jgi:hypothetical protein
VTDSLLTNKVTPSLARFFCPKTNLRLPFSVDKITRELFCAALISTGFATRLESLASHVKRSALHQLRLRGAGCTGQGLLGPGPTRDS